MLLKDKGVLEEGRMETHIFDSKLRILFTVGTVSCGGPYIVSWGEVGDVD